MADAAVRERAIIVYESMFGATRRIAEAIGDPVRHVLEPEATGTGIREWLDDKPARIRHHAAFDTRADMPRIFTGSAAAAIERRLLRLGSVHLDEPQSFLVDRDSHLLPGEVERARGWGMRIAERIVSAQAIAS